MLFSRRGIERELLYIRTSSYILIIYAYCAHRDAFYFERFLILFHFFRFAFYRPDLHILRVACSRYSGATSAAVAHGASLSVYAIPADR